MFSEFQKRKLALAFRYQDLNHDGFLERSDYEEYARRICEAQGFAPGSPEHERVYALTCREDRWTQNGVQIVDQDGDNRISFEEILEWCATVVSDENLFSRFVTGYVHSMMALWDRDQDGKLDVDEYAKLLVCHGVTDEAAREAFGHLDRDGDGYFTVHEGVEAIKDFYLSNDLDAPGNWLLGPF
jgi:Ca2+-binding EF-hand superfamily protein